MKTFFFGDLRMTGLIVLLGGMLMLHGCGGGSGSVSGGAADTAAASPAPEPPAAGAPATPPAPPAPGAPPGATTPSTAQPSATAVGSPTGNPASKTIGAAGGSLISADGKLTLTVPAGALASDTAISIQPQTNLAHGRRGAAYRLTPEGQTFLKPVTLSFGYTDQDVQGTAAGALGAAFQTGTGHWQWVGDATVDTAARTVSVASTHFSVWSAVAGIQLVPARKTVKVSQIVALQVVACYPAKEVAGLTPLGYACDVEGPAPLARAKEWSVNGRPGGGAFGTVSGDGLSATYTAPQFEPTPNIVAVSAALDGPNGRLLLVSNITVVGSDSWTGTASYKDRYNSAQVEVTWILLVRDNNIAQYIATGTGTMASDNGQCSFPATSGSIDSSGFLFVDYNTSPPTYRGSAKSGWPVTVTCPDSRKVQFIGLPYFGGNSGTEGVEAAGAVVVPLNPDQAMRIEGNDTDGTDGVFTWKFTRNP
ncbi:MAG: hypothetical protein LH617_11055 [Ramlibacter sp.]|nr:hypothetical protein [Ramlibacter sp.]